MAAARNYAGALSLYEQAFARVGEPRLLINIGRCHHRLGHPKQAIENYNRFLQTDVAQDSELTAQVRRFIDEAKEAMVADSNSPQAPSANAAKTLCDEQCLADVSRAEGLTEVRDYEGALAVYTETYARVKEPRLLINIGRCHYRLGRPRQALDFFHRFEQSPLGKDRELKESVDHFIKQAEEAVELEAKLTPQAPAPRLVDIQQGRPRWRLAVGGVGIGLGLTFIGLGAGAFSADGRCIEPSAIDMNLCTAHENPGSDRTTRVIDGISSGAALVTTGGVLLVAGVVMMALPGPRIVRLGWR